jgi:hypothetical protein
VDGGGKPVAYLPPSNKKRGAQKIITHVEITVPKNLTGAYIEATARVRTKVSGESGGVTLSYSLPLNCWDGGDRATIDLTPLLESIKDLK